MTAAVLEAVVAGEDRTLAVAVRILKGAVAARASDIHFRAGRPPLVRVDGALVPLEHPPLDASVIASVAAAFARASGTRVDPLAVRQSDFSFALPDVGRFRAHVYRQAATFAIVLRVIPRQIPDFAALRLPPVVKRIATLENGLVLVTGATGMGKSTTVASILEFVNQSMVRHVCTIEDPVEFVFTDHYSSFSQREIGRDVDGYDEGLRGALRADPDVLFLGEIRTFEALETVMLAAESGRLVISTVHTPDAMRTINRLVGFFPIDRQETARHRLADALKAVVAQRLVPRTGSSGRILAVEVMRASPTVRDCIRDPLRLKGLVAAIEAGHHEFGMQSFDQQLTALYKDGLVTLEAAKAAATSPADLVRNLSVSR